MGKLEEKELVKVATMYYEEGLTQAEIAKKMGVSRSLISKMIIDAKKDGIVEVFIKSDTAYTVDLERKLEEKYQLKGAVVVDTAHLNDNEIETIISQTAALYLKKISKDVKSIGVSWGGSLRKMIDCFPYTNQKDTVVYPLVGGVGDEHVEVQANQLCSDLARKMRGQNKYLYAPISVRNPQLKKEILSIQSLSNVLEEAKEVDLALVGLANPFKNSTMEKLGYINEEIKEELEKCRVKGDINWRFFDENGQENGIELNQNIIGVELADLKKIPKIFAIVYGEEKVEPIHLALENKLLNIIVTTDKVAEELLVKE